ncbi:unnamed protein product, partial [Rotaria sp. Silwood1]
SILTIAYSCSDTTVTPATGPEANSIAGTVTFADTNFGAVPVGYYDIAAFSSWPPSGPPAANDSLIISKVDGKYKANYTIRGLGTGVDSAKYTIAIGWRRRTGGASPTMGIYPCDTAHYNPVTSPCPFSPTKVVIRSNAGVNGVNVLAWADTTKRIF